ncbi:unnamed protein product [Miscanthus lutarioriparius]|uniref:O-methyltransferase C-terminal domain-containing protein n=1 Tax=Miscanthus lutarioriparius TaxID=422564 RepID=A0A811MFT0_9POAL|nr:unnamed protein product [Miscanthus lutarioriparius]
MALVEESSQDLLQAYVVLWHQSLCYAKSMALAVALDLRIPTIVLRECGEVFGGIDSLVDVAGVRGGATANIAAAFPHLKCSVLDLPHVVAGAPSDGTQALTTLHDWSDDECVKILKKCRQAISPRDAGGKIIILDMVVRYGEPNIKHLETQVMFDLYIMSVNGAERDEQEWKKISIEAGFKDYKILPVVGALSVIEVYP